MQKPMDDRLDTLSRCEGMDRARAERLLKLLPVLGCVPSELLLTFAALEPPHRRSPRIIQPRRAARIQAILVEAVDVACQDKNTRTATLLRRLGTAHPESGMRLCLTAMLRHFNDALRHSGGKV